MLIKYTYSRYSKYTIGFDLHSRHILSKKNSRRCGLTASLHHLNPGNLQQEQQKNTKHTQKQGVTLKNKVHPWTQLVPNLYYMDGFDQLKLLIHRQMGTIITQITQERTVNAKGLKMKTLVSRSQT